MLKKSRILILLMSLVFTACPEMPDEFVVLSLSESTGIISGIVTDNVTGSAISGATVTTDPSTKTVSTNSSGEYELTEIDPGQYTMSASKSGYVTNTKSVTVTAKNISTADIKLTEEVTTGSISGKVTDNATGSAMNGVTITTDPSTKTVSTNSSGEYELTEIDQGQYTVSASKSGYVTSTIGVTVTAGNVSTADIGLSATVSCPSTVAYEGKIYNTVLIGDQCWLKENLDVGTMIESNGGGHLQTDNGIIEKYCYDNDPANCETYGGLYEWPEAMQYSTTEGAQGICPNGWHMPTITEFETLEAFVNGKGAALIDESETLSYTPTVTQNETGFSALFAGYRSNYGYFDYLGLYTTFWSSTEHNSNDAYNMGLYSSISNVYLYSNYKEYGFSVRCVQD